MKIMLLAIGILVLVKGADLLIDGSTSLANRLKVPSLIIGLTVVAVGTSLPEFIINILSTLGGSTGLAFGNIVGSNIANTLLVLGAASIIGPLWVARSTVWKEIPFSLMAAFVLFVISKTTIAPWHETLYLTRGDGIMLLLFLLPFIYYLYWVSQQKASELVDEVIFEKLYSMPRTFVYIFIGILGLYLGGTWTVSSAIEIARNFGMSEFLIAATAVALGTSLPELITSIRASMRKDCDLAVGNVIGSNILNIFLVLGVTAIIAPVGLPQNSVLDFSFLITSSFLLFIFMFIGPRHSLSRWQGTVFISAYVLYLILVSIRG